MTTAKEFYDELLIAVSPDEEINMLTLLDTAAMLGIGNSSDLYVEQIQDIVQKRKLSAK